MSDRARMEADLANRYNTNSVKKTSDFLTKMAKAVLGLKKGGTVVPQSKVSPFFGKVSKIKNV